MLTGDLLAYTRRGERLIPRRLDPADPALLAAGEALLALFDAHLGQRRGELEEALAGFAPPGPAPKVARGLARLLLDRCTFRVGAEAEPAALRAALFDSAAAAWREQGVATLPRWRGDLLARVGAGQGLTGTQVEQALYADIPDNQVLSELRPITAEGLLYRYNVAQVQGLLLRAERLTVYAPWAAPARMRQLLGYLKFFGLLFRVEQGRRDGLAVVVDGPLSLLESGSRYGLNLAQFFPALLHWEPPWQVACELTPRPGRGRARLEVEPHPHLRSHYPDRGQWVPEEVRRFADAFNALGTPWRATPADEVLTLPGNAYLVPDFVFTQGGKEGRVFLEYLRYPVREQVQRRLELLERHGLDSYIVACRGVPAVRELAEGNPLLFAFRRNLLPGQAAKFLETLAGARQDSLL
jgi:predicted nuclease of restriction endonuclease-like RecB superfamily